MTLDELRKQAGVVQGHMNAITNLLSLAAVTQNINQLRAIKLVMEYESANMRRESDRLNAMMGEFKKEQSGMKRNILIMAVLVILMFVLVGGLPAVAQDIVPLATNTAVAALQPVVNDAPVEVTVEPTSAPAPDSGLSTYLPTRDELVDTFVKYGTVIIVTVLLVFGALFYRVAVMLALSVPQFAWDGAKGGLLSAEKQLEQRVKDSETPVDDALYPYLQKYLQKALDEIDAKRSQPVTSTAAVNPPGTYLFEKLPGDDDTGLG